MPAGRRYWSEQPLRGTDRGRERERRSGVQFKTQKRVSVIVARAASSEQKSSAVWVLMAAAAVRSAMATHAWSAHLNRALWIINEPVASMLWSFSLGTMEGACCFSGFWSITVTFFHSHVIEHQTPEEQIGKPWKRCLRCFGSLFSPGKASCSSAPSSGSSTRTCLCFPEVWDETLQGLFFF